MPFLNEKGERSSQNVPLLEEARRQVDNLTYFPVLGES